MIFDVSLTKCHCIQVYNQASSLEEEVDTENFLNGGIALAKITPHGSDKILEVNNLYMAAARKERFVLMIPGKETPCLLKQLLEIWDVEHTQVDY